MKLTRERKILGAVLALGLVGLAADRLLFADGASGPHAASASAVAVDAPAEPGRAPTGARVESATDQAEHEDDARVASVHALADRLESVDAAHEHVPYRDAFAVPERWLAEVEPDARPQQPPQDAIDNFVRDHRLMAVIGAGQNATAMIVGPKGQERLMRVGESIAGFTLVKIDTTGMTAMFRSDSGEARIQRVSDAVDPAR